MSTGQPTFNEQPTPSLRVYRLLIAALAKFSLSSPVSIWSAFRAELYSRRVRSNLQMQRALMSSKVVFVSLNTVSLWRSQKPRASAWMAAAFQADEKGKGQSICTEFMTGGPLWSSSKSLTRLTSTAAGGGWFDFVNTPCSVKYRRSNAWDSHEEVEWRK